MVANILFYQIYDKEMVFDFNSCFKSLLIFWIIIFINDIILTTFQRFSIGGPKTNLGTLKAAIICFVSIGIFQIIIMLNFLSYFQIEGYYKFFIAFKYIWITLTILRSISAFCEMKVLSDIIRLFEPIIIINLILIGITDPIVNEEAIPNKITFYEIYFRFIEFQILVIGFNLIYFDSNIDNDVTDKQFTLSAVIGRYDSFRFTVFIIIIHYFFILINVFAFSYKYIFILII